MSVWVLICHQGLHKNQFFYISRRVLGDERILLLNFVIADIHLSSAFFSHLSCFICRIRGSCELSNISVAAEWRTELKIWKLWIHSTFYTYDSSSDARGVNKPQFVFITLWLYYSSLSFLSLNLSSWILVTHAFDDRAPWNQWFF